jgi:hypothetical protein
MPATAIVQVSATGAIVAAVAGQRITVWSYHLSFAGSVNVKWQDGASTDLTGLDYGAANIISNSPPVTDQQGKSFLFRTSLGNALYLNLSGAVAVGGYVIYEQG